MQRQNLKEIFSLLENLVDNNKAKEAREIYMASLKNYRLESQLNEAVINGDYHSVKQLVKIGAAINEPLGIQSRIDDLNKQAASSNNPNKPAHAQILKLLELENTNQNMKFQIKTCQLAGVKPDAIPKSFNILQTMLVTDQFFEKTAAQRLDYIMKHTNQFSNFLGSPGNEFAQKFLSSAVGNDRAAIQQLRTTNLGANFLSIPNSHNLFMHQIKEKLGDNFIKGTKEERAQILASPEMSNARHELNELFRKNDESKNFFSNFIKVSLGNDEKLLAQIQHTSTGREFLASPAAQATPAEPSKPGAKVQAGAPPAASQPAEPDRSESLKKRMQGIDKYFDQQKHDTQVSSMSPEAKAKRFQSIEYFRKEQKRQTLAEYKKMAGGEVKEAEQKKDSPKAITPPKVEEPSRGGPRPR